jgi:predicted ATPase
MIDRSVTALGGSSSDRDDVALEELVYESERCRVVRRFLASGTIIEKRAVGDEAAKRVRHETAMLERVSAVPGVAKMSPAIRAADTICFQDDGGVPISSLAQARTFSVGELLELALALAGTIAAIHRLGVVHRDLNPSNILLVGPGLRPVVIDFDIASTSAEERPAFTARAEIQGTLAYIAPEQTGRTGRSLDQRADLYAFGATLYELATGHTPFEGDDAFAIICDHLLRVPTPPATVDPEIPQALSDIIMRLLQKEPDRRYQSADGVAADLSLLIERLARGEREPFALAAHDFPQRLVPPSRLIGREPEIAALHAAFEDALAGRGSGLFIAGAAGVGKTVLCDELRALVTAKGGWFVSGKCDRFRLDSAPDALHGAFRSLVRLLLAEPEAELEVLRPRLVAALGSNLGLAAATLPGLATLLGVVPGVEQQHAPPGAGRLASLSLDLLRAIAAARPVVFVIDDLQWASAIPLRLVDAIVSDPSFPGLLFVGAYREADVDAVHPLSVLLARRQQSSAPARIVRLENLEGPGLVSLVQEMLRLGAEDAGRLAAAVASRTGGNPYDTTEFINALRRDGALTYGPAGWSWDEATIRHYVGRGDVVDMLAARIDALPSDSVALLGVMACLGGEVSMTLLEAAAGRSGADVEGLLTPAREDGLVVLERGAGTVVRFRHDRVQQAALRKLDPQALKALHLALARRLSAIAGYENIAAEQYLPAIDMVTESDECLRVIALLRSAAVLARRLPSDVAVERFTAAAVGLLGKVAGANPSLAADLDIELHQALYRLGRLDDADVVFASIVRRGGEPLATVDCTCVQLSSLSVRNMLGEALTLGLEALGAIGLSLPARDRLGAFVELLRQALYLFCDADETESLAPRGLAAIERDELARVKLINRVMIAAYYHDRTIRPWLDFEALKLWRSYGPMAVLVSPMSQVACVSIVLLDDFRIGYRVARKILRAAETGGFEPQTSVARFWFAYGNQHWFEPFEDCLAQARASRDGLLQGGDLETAGHTYSASIQFLLQCSPELDEYAVEVEAGIVMSRRIGNERAVNSFLPHRQFARALRGETSAVGGFNDASFDEQTYLARIGGNQTVEAYFHVVRALCAYTFDRTPDLLDYSAAAIALVSRVAHSPLSALAHQLRAAAVARLVRESPAADRPALLAELDLSLDWLRRRAVDAPQNFSHMARLIEAERAWAQDDFGAASSAFAAALQEAESSKSPRTRALIAERAARCYLEHGLERFGRLLLRDAHRLYGAWGATAKVRLLETEYPFLITVAAVAPSTRHTETTSTWHTNKTSTQHSDTTISLSSHIDMVGILRASQALSSQTSLQRL